MEINYEETKKLLEERKKSISNINALTIASIGAFTIVGSLSVCLMLERTETSNINNIIITCMSGGVILNRGISLCKNFKELKEIKQNLKELENYKLQKTLNR